MGLMQNFIRARRLINSVGKWPLLHSTMPYTRQVQFQIVEISLCLLSTADWQAIVFFPRLAIVILFVHSLTLAALCILNAELETNDEHIMKT
jgi:hypothetical protein